MFFSKKKKKKKKKIDIYSFEVLNFERKTILHTSIAIIDINYENNCFFYKI